MKVATLGRGPRLEIVKALMDKNGIDYVSCDLSSKKGKEKASDLEDCFLIFLALTPIEIRDCCRTIAPYISGRHAIVHMVHALESDNHQAVSKILENELSTQRFGFLSGPMRLSDVEKDLPSSVLCASELNEIHDVVSESLSRPHFRVYRSTDLHGAEIAAIYARVISFCVGIAFDLGESVQSLVFARGLAEASRLIVRVDGKSHTAFGLSGLANLHLAIGANPTMDHQLGRDIAKKGRKKSAAAKAHYSEFQALVHNLKCTSNQAGLNSNILNAAHALVCEELSTKEVMAILMALPELSE